MRNSLIILSTLFTVAACDAKATTTEAAKTEPSTASATDKPVAKPVAKPAPKAEAAAPVEMIDHDLSAQKGWEGFHAKGPDYAKVMGELHSGARIAGGTRLDKKEPFDVRFYAGKNDFVETKEGHTKSTASPAGVGNGAKVSYTTDTPELLEWTYESGGAPHYGFFSNFQVGGKDISCTSDRAPTPEARERAKESCKSLAKR